MSLSLRTTLGCTEAVLADDGSLNLFYHVAGIINEDLRIKFLNKEDEFDAINWDFKYKGHPLTLTIRYLQWHLCLSDKSQCRIAKRQPGGSRTGQYTGWETV